MVTVTHVVGGAGGDVGALHISKFMVVASKRLVILKGALHQSITSVAGIYSS